MTVLVTGATGFVGGHLVRRLLARGDSVIVLTRDAHRAERRLGSGVRVLTDLSALDPQTPIDAVVNLAGAPILGLPWTRARRSELLKSRVGTTLKLVSAMGRLTHPPAALISASAIGYYGVRGDEPVNEHDQPQSAFQSQLCQRWEATAESGVGPETRVVILRLGVVLGRDGGALPQFLAPVRLGLGAVLGSGAQWISWIHIDDLIDLIEFALATSAARGPFNAVSPMPVTHLQFQRALASTLRRPMWFRVPAFILRILLGEMAQLLVDGQRVLPSRAVALGFKFRHARIEGALSDLLRRPAELHEP